VVVLTGYNAAGGRTPGVGGGGMTPGGNACGAGGNGICGVGR